jgi:hypothetical protein
LQTGVTANKSQPLPRASSPGPNRLPTPHTASSSNLSGAKVGAKLPVPHRTPPDSPDCPPDRTLLSGLLYRAGWTIFPGLLIRRFWVQVPGGVPPHRPLTRENTPAAAFVLPGGSSRVPKWVPNYSCPRPLVRLATVDVLPSIILTSSYHARDTSEPPARQAARDILRGISDHVTAGVSTEAHRNHTNETGSPPSVADPATTSGLPSSGTWFARCCLRKYLDQLIPSLGRRRARDATARGTLRAFLNHTPAAFTTEAHRRHANPTARHHPGFPSRPGRPDWCGLGRHVMPRGRYESGSGAGRARAD